MNARTRKRLDKGLRWLARALNQTPLVRRPLSRLKPHRHLRCEENAAGTGFEWQAVGDDPQFRLTRELPVAGLAHA